MARKGKGKEVSKTELAESFGVSATTVEHWIRVGCPYRQRGAKGKAWIFSTSDVYEWRLNRVREENTGTDQAGEQELKRRKLAAETAKAELELAKLRQEVAPIDQMQRAMSMAFAEVKANMRNVPNRVVTLLIGESNETRFKKVLLEEIDQALEALADSVLVEEEDLVGSED